MSFRKLGDKKWSFPLACGAGAGLITMLVTGSWVYGLVAIVAVAGLTLTGYGLGSGDNRRR